MNTTKTLLILCVALCFASACKKDVDKTLVQKTVLENADIRQIKVSDGWEVNVVADSSTFVELEYSAYLEESLKTQMSGTCLEIGFAESTYPEINSEFHATVHVRRLEKVNAEESAKIKFGGAFEGAELFLELNDASICNGLDFRGDYCEIYIDDVSKLLDFQFIGHSCKATLHNASQFNGQIHASETLNVDLGEASRFVNKGGLIASANLKLQENSLLNIVETEVNEINVNLSDVSVATVWASGLLKGSLKEASILYYKGTAQIDLDCSDGSQLIPL